MNCERYLLLEGISIIYTSNDSTEIITLIGVRKNHKQRIRAPHTLDARNIKVVPCPRLRRLSCSCILTWLSDDVSVFRVEVRSVNNIYQLIISLLTITIAFYFFHWRLSQIIFKFTRSSELHFLPQCNSWFSFSSVT